MSLDKPHTIRFDQGIYGESGSILALTPGAVAAVNDEWI
jgi:hypothetical protein